jgi:hypothetical protein
MLKIPSCIFYTQNMSKISKKLIVVALLAVMVVEPTLVKAFSVDGYDNSLSYTTNTSQGVLIQNTNTSTGVTLGTQNYQRANTSGSSANSTAVNTSTGVTLGTQNYQRPNTSGTSTGSATQNYQTTNTSTGVPINQQPVESTQNYQTTNTSTGVRIDDGSGWNPSYYSGYYSKLPHISACNGRAYPKDIDGHWAEIYVRRLYDLCIIEGYGDGKFHPNQNITRAELVKMALYAKGIKPNSGCYDSDCGSPFTDLDMWQGKWIRPAWDKNIVEGYSYNRFRPNKAITRAEAVKIILATYGEDPENTDKSFFNDVSGWSTGWIEKAHELGIVQGIGNGNFDPNRAITRAEAAKIIAKMMEHWDTKIR